MTAMTSPQRLTDAQLVTRFRAGDETAFRAIHDRYREALLAFARRMLHGSGHDADDVVQDALIRAHAGLRATDRPMALKPWLYMIVRNRALDDLRIVQRTDELEEGRHLSLVGGTDVAHIAEERAEVRWLVDEIARLPERQRLALVGRELEGVPHAEVARRLGTTVPATKSLLIRARAQLREAAGAAA